MHTLAQEILSDIGFLSVMFGLGLGAMAIYDGVDAVKGRRKDKTDACFDAEQELTRLRAENARQALELDGHRRILERLRTRAIEAGGLSGYYESAETAVVTALKMLQEEITLLRSVVRPRKRRAA